MRASSLSKTIPPIKHAASPLATSIRGALLCMALAGAAHIDPAMSQEAAARTVQRDYAIPTGTLSEALNRFASESDVALSFEPAQVAGLHSNGLRGRYTVANGFAALLEGTGLRILANADGRGYTVQKIPVDGGEDVIVTDALSIEGQHASDKFDTEAPWNTAAPVSAIGSDAIQTRYAGNPQTALRSTPGVFTRQSSNQPGIEVNIRGMSGYGRVNGMIDGVPQTFKNIAGHEASGGSLLYVHPELLGGVSITRGAVSGAHGAGTLTGAADFRTVGIDDGLLAEGKDYGLLTRVKFGDNGAHKSAALIYGQRFNGLWGGDGRIDLVAGYAYTGTGSYHAGDNTEIEGGRLGYASDNAPKGGLVKLDLVANAAHRFNLGVRTYENRFINSTYDWKIENRTWTAGYDYTPGSNWLNLDVDLHYNDANLNYLGTSGSYAGRHTEDVSYGISATNHASSTLSNGADLLLNYGLSWARNDFRTHAMRGGNHPGELDKASVFSDVAIDFGRYSLLAGLRYDWWRIHGWRAPYNAGWGDCPADGPSCGDEWVTRDSGKLLPKIGASFQATDDLELYATYSHTFRPPTSHEAFFALVPFGDGKGTGVVNNLDLEPETNRGWDLGMNYVRDGLWRKDDSLRFKLGYFRNEIENFVVNDFVDVPGRGSSAKWVNRPGTTLMHGIELEGNYDAGAFYTNFSFSDTHTADQPNGNGAGGGNGEGMVQPTRVGTLDLGLRLFDRKLTLGVQGRYVGEGKEIVFDWLTGDSYWATTDSYSLLDLYGTLQLNSTSQIFFSVENVQDKRYGYAGSGMSGFAGQYGRGRTLIVGYSGQLASMRPGEFDGDWGGFYAGSRIGSLSASIRGTTTAGDGTPGDTPASESAHVDHDNAITGAFGGHNWQFGNGVVLGLELGLDRIDSGKERKFISLETPGYSYLAEDPEKNLVQAGMRYHFDRAASARLRVGRGFGRVLFYGLGGLTILRETQTRTQYAENGADGVSTIAFTRQTTPWFAESVSANRYGWTAGLGAEVALGEHWSLRAEYSYSQFRRRTTHFDDARSGVVKDWVQREQVGTTIEPPAFGADDPYCQSFPTGWPCEATEVPVYEDTPVTGSANVVNGRRARDKYDMQVFQLGLTWRF